MDVLLIEVEPAELERVAERLRALAAAGLAQQGNPHRVWGGVAGLDAHDRSFEDLASRVRLLEQLGKASGTASLRSLETLDTLQEDGRRLEESLLLEELATLMLRRMEPGQGMEQRPTPGEWPEPMGRQEFFALGQQEWARARRFERPLSVLLFDLDHLALINERWGRRSGDTVVQTVLDLIRQQLRQQTSSAGWGETASAC